MMRSNLKFFALFLLVFSSNGFTQETTHSIAFNAGIGMPKFSTRDYFWGDTERDMFNQAADADKMIYLIVGDAKTQLSRLRGLGFGNPLLLDRNDNTTK